MSVPGMCPWVLGACPFRCLSIPRCPCVLGMCPCVLGCAPSGVPQSPQLSMSPLSCHLDLCLQMFCVPRMYPQVSLCPQDVSLGVPASLGCDPSGVPGICVLGHPGVPRCVLGCVRVSQTSPGRGRDTTKAPRQVALGTEKAIFNPKMLPGHPKLPFPGAPDSWEC